MSQAKHPEAAEEELPPPPSRSFPLLQVNSSVLRPEPSLKGWEIHSGSAVYLGKCCRGVFSHGKRFQLSPCFGTILPKNTMALITSEQLGQIKLFFLLNVFNCSQTSAACRIPACDRVALQEHHPFSHPMNWNPGIPFPAFPALSLGWFCMATALDFFISLPIIGTNSPFQSLHPVGL